MSFIDPSVYEQQKQGILSQYNNNSAMNALGRFVSQQRSNRTIADSQRDWGRSMPRWTASWGKRGMAGPGVQSGVYQNAMRNYVGDYQQNLNRQYADQQYDLNEYDLKQAGYDTQKQTAMADIETNKAREIANAAQYLNQLKGQFQ